ncbi:MAG: hypothetical protein ACOCVF_04295 [bacterium]
MKTVELIEEIEDWEQKPNKISWNKIMHLKVAYGETHIDRLIRAAGGKWNKENWYWELEYREVISLGLESRIIHD